MLTKADLDDFIHTSHVDDGFLICQKDFTQEEDKSSIFFVREDFEHSHQFTKLKTAKAYCELMLDLLGVETYFKDSKLRLSVEVIIDKEKPELGSTH